MTYRRNLAMAALALGAALALPAPPASATIAGSCYPPSHPDCRRLQAQREAQMRAEQERAARERQARMEAERRAREQRQREADARLREMQQRQQLAQQQQRQYQQQQQQYQYQQQQQQQQQRRNQYGALAIDHNQGQAYGWAVNFSSQSEADSHALSRCGGRCSVVMRFHNACAAYSGDQVAGSTATGWAWASSLGQAQNTATQYCQSRGGRYCQLRVWGCSGA